MAEGAKDQEIKPIITNLFPLEKQSVVDAFNKLSLTTNPDGAQAEMDQEMSILQENNPSALNYFVQMLGGFRAQNIADKADEIFWGILVSHKALREQAKYEGGVVPTLTKEFVQDYATKRERKIKSISKDKNISIPEAVIQLGRQDLVGFENMEPGFSSIVGREDGAQSEWGPEQDLRYLGIVELYSLFRKGCSDPKNFSETPNKKIS